MANKRVKIKFWHGRGVQLVGDIVTDNFYFPDSPRADHWKILALYEVLTPYKDETRPPVRRAWMNIECVKSQNPALVGTQMSDPVGYRKVGGRRTLADFVAGKDAEIEALRRASMAALGALTSRRRLEEHAHITPITTEEQNALDHAADTAIEKLKAILTESEGE